MIENNLQYIKKITWDIYKKYKLNIYYDYEEVLNEVIVYLHSTIKYYDSNKSKLTSFLYMQVSNKCKRLIEDINSPSKLLNYNFNIKFSLDETRGIDEEVEINLYNTIEDNINIENDIVSSDRIKSIMNLFKNDELKLNIIKLVLIGYKRNEISKLLNIKTRQFDYQRNLIKREIEKIVI